jgi:hypothetical protein
MNHQAHERRFARQISKGTEQKVNERKELTVSSILVVKQGDFRFQIGDFGFQILKR